ncbi:MAG: dienelactone hydrolase family protein [Formivibrio sp.]|nr:dienelactone hydrolase family protein [Formivibrio sp.]
MLLRIISLLVLLGVSFPANAYRVRIPAGDLRLPAEYLAPVRSGMPAVLVLHGCGGLFAKSGEIGSRMSRMGNLLQEMGYAVLYPDSFTPRGVKQVCTSRSSARIVTPHIRADDAEAAIRWLRVQKDVDGNRIGVLGWSQGADAALELLGRKHRWIKAAVTYYPACRSFANDKDYRVSAPTLVLIGDRDEWTPAQDCKNLATETGQDLFHVVTYPEALHDFDAPVTYPYVENDIANRVKGMDGVLSAPDPDVAHDANRRTFKWFARWFDPERAIPGFPPSKYDH